MTRETRALWFLRPSSHTLLQFLPLTTTTMEKVLQRAKYAEGQAVKRMKKRKKYIRNTEDWQRLQNTQRIGRVFNQNLVAARKNRALDWNLGALAPRRDIGEKATSYGAMSIYDFNLPEVAHQERPAFMHLSEGDRVVVWKGRERGKIGEIEDINKERHAVRISGMNMADIQIPEWIDQQAGVEKQELQSISRYIPVEDVRLVYPLPDPESGVPKDTIVERLEGIKRRSPREVKRGMEEGHQWDRYIPGTNTVIPWPAMAENTEESFEVDTPAMSVAERSFRPYLLAAPMPVSVIDELRNKYSKFRTRHEPEFIEQKEAEAERVERRKGLGKTMRTPLQELAEVRAKQKKAAERELSEEQLARIGEVIEREEKKAVGGVRDGGVVVERRGTQE